MTCSRTVLTGLAACFWRRANDQFAGDLGVGSPSRSADAPLAATVILKTLQSVRLEYLPRWNTTEVETMLRLRADARRESVRPLRNAVVRVASDMGLSDSQLYAVKFCVNEAITNAVNHAYPGDQSGPLDVRMREVADELEIVVADQGRASHREPPDDHAGFGLGFISRLMDRCIFTAAPCGTRLEMRFRLPRRKRDQLNWGSLSGDSAKGASLFSMPRRWTPQP